MDPVAQMALDAAYGMALKSLSEGGLPIGAALVSAEGDIVAVGHNLRVQEGDPTAHAETACLRRAGRRTDWHTLTMATTLSPCAMCSGAAYLYKIPRIVIGENRNFQGREDWLRERGAEILLADDPRCVLMMERFIRENPALWNEDIGVPPGRRSAKRK